MISKDSTRTHAVPLALRLLEAHTAPHPGDKCVESDQRGGHHITVVTCYNLAMFQFCNKLVQIDTHCIFIGRLLYWHILTIPQSNKTHSIWFWAAFGGTIRILPDPGLRMSEASDIDHVGEPIGEVRSSAQRLENFWIRWLREPSLSKLQPATAIAPEVDEHRCCAPVSWVKRGKHRGKH